MMFKGKKQPKMDDDLRKNVSKDKLTSFRVDEESELFDFVFKKIGNKRQLLNQKSLISH